VVFGLPAEKKKNAAGVEGEREREIHSCSQSEAAAAALPPHHLLSCFFPRRHDAHADESENQPR
jgi:hypothetical protein